VADVQILRPSASAVPSNYVLPDAAELRLKAVYAEFTDNGAAGDWLPCVTILSDSGDVIGRAVDQGVKVTAGDNADVTWFPWLKQRGAAAAAGPSCKLLGSGNGNTTLTVTLTADVPATGTLHIVEAQNTLGHNDAGSEPTAVSDSKGVAGWNRPAIPNNSPLIGQIRQTDAAFAWDMQLGSCARPCTAGDLVAGDTITVTYGSGFPADFYTTGLIVYQPAYYVRVSQSWFGAYGFADSYPDFDTSPTDLNWDRTYVGFDNVPLQDCHRIVAVAAYPPLAGFVPVSGTVVGEIASGQVSLAVTCLPLCQGQLHEPGGSWPSACDGLIGNYQVAQPRVCTN
jgi:hypothetical protein